MTAEAAVFEFFNSFEIPAYLETSVPDEARFPYLTYTGDTSSWYSESGATISVNLFYYGASEVGINAKVRELYYRLRDGGVMLPCDDGCIWLTVGEPWCQSMEDPEDKSVKRRYININRQDLR